MLLYLWGCSFSLARFVRGVKMEVVDVHKMPKEYHKLVKSLEKLNKYINLVKNESS